MKLGEIIIKDSIRSKFISITQARSYNTYDMSLHVTIIYVNAPNNNFNYKQRYEAFKRLLGINFRLRMSFQREFKNSVNVR